MPSDVHGIVTTQARVVCVFYLEDLDAEYARKMWGFEIPEDLASHEFTWKERAT